MNWRKYKPYLWGIGITEAVGGLSALLSKNGMERYDLMVKKPPLTPPMLVFPVAWGTLYALMGISAVRIWKAPKSRRRSWGLNLFISQLILNFFWSLIFFNAAAYALATAWLLSLWAVVLAMIWLFYGVDRLAAWLQIPYLIWLTFAAYLTIGVWMLNG
jgi:tryptophan-rich sensory protein